MTKSTEIGFLSCILSSISTPCAMPSNNDVDKTQTMAELKEHVHKTHGK